MVVTMLTCWHIERRVPIEEAGRLQRKTNHLNWHNGPIFRPDNMIRSERVPHHDVCMDERTVLLRIPGETIATGRLVRVLSCCVTLCLIVRGDPQVLPGESSALPLGGSFVKEGKGIARRYEFVGNGLTQGVAPARVHDLPEARGPRFDLALRRGLAGQECLTGHPG